MFWLDVWQFGDNIVTIGILWAQIVEYSLINNWEMMERIQKFMLVVILVPPIFVSMTLKMHLKYLGESLDWHNSTEIIWNIRFQSNSLKKDQNKTRFSRKNHNVYFNIKIDNYNTTEIRLGFTKRCNWNIDLLLHMVQLRSCVHIP